MNLISNGMSIRPEIITSLTLDVCKRQWIREVKCELVKDDGERTLWITDRVRGQKLLKLSDKFATNPGVNIIDFGDGLYYINRKAIDPDTGKKIAESVLYEVNPETGNIFKVSHLLIGYSHIDPGLGISNSDLFYAEDPKSYANVLEFLRDYRKESVENLFVKVEDKDKPGVYTYCRFLDVVEDLILSVLSAEV